MTPAPVPFERGCLSCKHHGFKEAVVCNHPQRPLDKRLVVRWTAGCPQHQPLKETLESHV